MIQAVVHHRGHHGSWSSSNGAVSRLRWPAACRHNRRPERVRGRAADVTFRLLRPPNTFSRMSPNGRVARTAAPDPKVPRATSLGCPTTLPMAPKPAHDLTKHMCQRAGPAGRVGGRQARLRGRSRPSCRDSREEALGDATRLRPSEPRRASRKLPTRSARRERKPGRLARED